MALSSPFIPKPLLSIHPGEWYFGVEYERLHTVLGSCVALVVWHPKLKVGGLCHYLLSTSPRVKSHHPGDCRYADNALAKMKQSMLSYAAIAEFQVSVFGGGDMFACNTSRSIGTSNIVTARQWIMKEKIQLHQTDVGGSISRSLALVVPTGEIQLKRYAMNPQQRL